MYDEKIKLEEGINSEFVEVRESTDKNIKINCGENQIIMNEEHLSSKEVIYGGEVIDEKNKSQVINNNKGNNPLSASESYTYSSKENLAENNQIQKFYENDEYQRQPEIHDDEYRNSDMEISEEAIFNYSYQKDVLFNNYSQTYDNDSSDSISMNDKSEIFGLCEIEKRELFEMKPERIFKELISKLSMYKLKLFHDNIFLRSQIEAYQSNNSSTNNKFEDTENQFNLTNNFDGKNQEKELPSRLQSNLTSQNIQGRVSIEGKGNNKVVEDLMNELSTLVDAFEKSKNKFNSSHLNTAN